jgi:hypothetical protein
MKRAPLREPKLTAFYFPAVRTLEDMTPEERVKVARELGAPLSGYDAQGRSQRVKSDESVPCPDPYCDGVA